jgi:hypothetical protein
MLFNLIKEVELLKKRPKLVKKQEDFKFKVAGEYADQLKHFEPLIRLKNQNSTFFRKEKPR